MLRRIRVSRSCQTLFQFFPINIEVIADLVEIIKLLITQQKINGGHQHRYIM